MSIYVELYHDIFSNRIANITMNPTIDFEVAIPDGSILRIIDEKYEGNWDKYITDVVNDVIDNELEDTISNLVTKRIKKDNKEDIVEDTEGD